MKQASLGLNLSTKRTRKREFLDEMERVAPWKVLVEIIEPHWPKSKTGRPLFSIEKMLRIHYMQQWFGLSDPAMEEALHDVPLYLVFAGLSNGSHRIPASDGRFGHAFRRPESGCGMNTGQWRWTATGLVSVCLALPLPGCGKEPTRPGAGRGSSSRYGPQVIIKGQDVYLDGKLIQLQKTTAAEVKALTGFDPSDQSSADAYWNATGIIIFASTQDHLPGQPKLVHSFRVWFQQDDDSSVRMPCTLEQRKLHEASVQTRLASMDEEERTHNFPRDEEARARLLGEVCTWPSGKPRQIFQGDLEVGGMPVSSNMTLGQIQSRRRSMGLLPLRVHPVSGRPYFQAPIAKEKPGWRQEWEFSWPTEEINGDDLAIKVISVP
jgi:hypothetical protein